MGQPTSDLDYTQILTPDELGERLKVLHTWIYEKARKRGLDSSLNRPFLIARPHRNPCIRTCPFTSLGFYAPENSHFSWSSFWGAGQAVLRWAPLSVAGQDVANEIPTNLPGVTTSIAPPEGFDPLGASDEELATYGFPPRPDAQAAPKAYASWARAVAASKKRVIPQLEVTNIFHTPNRRLPGQLLKEGVRMVSKR